MKRRNFSIVERDVLAVAALFPITWQSAGELCRHLKHSIDDMAEAVNALASPNVALLEERGGFYCITRHGIRLIDAAGGAGHVLIHGGNGIALRKQKEAA